jgi:hypothetical protein
MKSGGEKTRVGVELAQASRRDRSSGGRDSSTAIPTAIFATSVPP